MSILTSPDRLTEIQRREIRLLALAFAFLSLSSLALSFAPAVRQADWSAVFQRLSHLVLVPLWAAAAWVGHRVLNRARPARDPFLFPIAMLLSGWGALVVWRLLPEFGGRQASWLLVGAVVLIEITRRSDDLIWLRRYRYVWLVGGTLLTALTLLFGTNPSGGDPQLWLGCCGLYFQPSEVLRLLLVAFLASFFADRIAHRWSGERWPLLPTLLPLLILWAVSIILLAIQRDLGTGILFVALLASLVYLVSGSRIVIAAALVFVVIGALLAGSQVGLVQARLDAWLQPWDDPTGNAYQLIQGLIAMASGGLLGSGPGLGSPGFVPAAHTDYVFAAIVEEWGLLGGLAVVALLFTLVHRGLKAAAMANSGFGFVLAGGVSLMFGLQAILILGGVLRLLPLTGVTVPFVSYGGSSLLTSFVALAFLLHVSGKPGVPFARHHPPLIRLHLLLGASFLALAAAAGWWVVVRGPVLIERNDNPRRAVSQRISARGRLLDREGRVLADTIGDRGRYQRRVISLSSAPVVGYDSAAFGRSGAEALLDRTLRGLQGKPPLEIWWSQLLTNAPPSGLDVRLTIDVDLQDLTAELIGDSPGAAVVLQADSGRILALQSQPRIDPNQLDEQVANLLARQDAPLLNRATQASYQPGPLIAPLLYAVALDSSLEPIKSVPDIGRAVEFPGGARSCARVLGTGVEGTMSVGLRLGCPGAALAIEDHLEPNVYTAMTQILGLDERVPISGQPVLVATPDFRSAELGREAIGQGQLTLSPLQAARAYAALFNGGRLPEVRFVEAIQTPAGSWIPQTGAQPQEVLSPAVSRQVAELLTAANGKWAYTYGSALRGQESTLAWFVGSELSSVDTPIVVIVLEGATPERARDAGEALLRWLEAASLDPPTLRD